MIKLIHDDSFLPIFNNRFNISNSRIDRCVINIDNLEVALEEDINPTDYFYALANAPDSIFSGYNRNAYRSNNYIRLNIRGNKHLSGNATFNLIANRTYKAKFELTLNHTRYIQSNSNERSNLRTITPFTLDVDTEKRARTKRRTLDENDNVLTSKNWLHSSKPNYKCHLYINRCFNEICSVLQAGESDNQENDASIYTGNTSISMSQTEVYWDFQHKDAIDYIKFLEYRLRSIANKGQIRNFTNKFDKNSLVLYFDLTDNITIKIYSKSNTRIRFEVTYKENLRTIFSPRLRGTRASLETENLIELAKADAASRLTKFMSSAYLKNYKPTTLNQFSEFNIAVVKACGGNSLLAKHLISVIFSNGRIKIDEKNKKAVLKLYKQGYLRKAAPLKNKGNIYPLNNELLGLVRKFKRLA